MAVPTDVLNDDIRKIRGDIREIRGKVDLVKDGVYGVGISQAEIKGEFRLIKTLLSLVIAGIAGSLWQFNNLNAKVGAVETRLDRLEASVDTRLGKFEDSVKTRLDRLEVSVDSRLGKFEDSIAKILEQTKPQSPK